MQTLKRVQGDFASGWQWDEVSFPSAFGSRAELASASG